jgi:hypothetical protein
MADHAEPFHAEALAENRSGHLTSDQATRFQRMASGRRNSTRGLAVPVGAIGALLLILSGPAATAATRHLAGLGFVAAAAVILAAPAFDPLAADVREGRVETVQGAVGKRRTQSKGPAGGTTRYYLNIAGRQLQTYLSAYEAAPDAGYVRAYYLPRTRRLVNLERLPNPPLPSDPGEARDMVGRIVRGLVTHDPAAIARANAGGLMDAAREFVEPSDAPRGPVAGGLVREALDRHHGTDGRCARRRPPDDSARRAAPDVDACGRRVTRTSSQLADSCGGRRGPARDSRRRNPIRW